MEIKTHHFFNSKQGKHLLFTLKYKPQGEKSWKSYGAVQYEIGKEGSRTGRLMGILKGKSEEISKLFISYLLEKKKASSNTPSEGTQETHIIRPIQHNKSAQFHPKPAHKKTRKNIHRRHTYHFGSRSSSKINPATMLATIISEKKKLISVVKKEIAEKLGKETSIQRKLSQIKDEESKNIEELGKLTQKLMISNRKLNQLKAVETTAKEVCQMAKKNEKTICGRLGRTPIDPYQKNFQDLVGQRTDIEAKCIDARQKELKIHRNLDHIIEAEERKRHLLTEIRKKQQIVKEELKNNINVENELKGKIQQIHKQQNKLTKVFKKSSYCHNTNTTNSPQETGRVKNETPERQLMLEIKSLLYCHLDQVVFNRLETELEGLVNKIILPKRLELETHLKVIIKENETLKYLYKSY
jgi:hypothetical protein